MGLEQLMDGAMCTGVLVEGTADAVAAALGTARAATEGGPPAAYVAEIEAIGWCRVEHTAEVAQSERGYDSDPLLVEALSAMNDVPSSETALGVDTPVRTARRLSELLGVAAIGIWASDQGPGIGGAVRFDRGERSWCYSAAGPADVEFIDRARDAETDAGMLSEEMEQGFETLDERSEERTWSASGVIEGEVSEHVNKALADLGVDPDWIEEPVWAVAGTNVSPEEITRLVWVD